MAKNRLRLRGLGAALGLMLLAACGGAKQVVVAPLPPPPAPVVIPARPLPPLGSVAAMAIPALDAYGVRQTINANLTPAQKVWNLRSALNVAALNCLEPKFQPILDVYKATLKSRAKELAKTNRALDAEFRVKFGPTFQVVRDSYMTQVYNYFALPPTLPQFCEVALTVSNELVLLPPADLETFAAGALARLDTVFETFFRSYDQYRVEVAAWDAQYGPLLGTTPAAYAQPLAFRAAAPAPVAQPSPSPYLPAPVAAPAPAAPGLAVQPAPLYLPAPVMAAPAPAAPALLIPNPAPAPVMTPAPVPPAVAQAAPPQGGLLVVPPPEPVPATAAAGAYGPSEEGGR